MPLAAIISSRLGTALWIPVGLLPSAFHLMLHTILDSQPSRKVFSWSLSDKGH